MNTFIKFSAHWCAPCKQMDIQLRRLGLDTSVNLVDIDVTPETGKQYNIRSIPTVVKLDEQGIEIGRLIGVQTDDKLREFVSHE